MSANNYIARPIEVQAFQYGVDPEPEWFKEAVSSGTIMLYRYRFTIEDAGDVFEFEGGTVLNRSGGFAVGSYLVRKENGFIEIYSSDEFNQLYEPA